MSDFVQYNRCEAEALCNAIIYAPCLLVSRVIPLLDGNGNAG
jgi:hypothetical protein